MAYEQPFLLNPDLSGLRTRHACTRTQTTYPIVYQIVHDVSVNV